MLMNQYFVSLLSKVMVVGQGVPLCQSLRTDATQHKMVMPRMVAQMAICFIAPPPFPILSEGVECQGECHVMRVN